MHYLRGKADWMLRGLPCDPAPSMLQKLRALPYFINNLTPGIRARWIVFSKRPTVAQSMMDDSPRLDTEDPIVSSFGTTDVGGVVLNPDGILLGAIEPNARGGNAIDGMNPAPQTIRPDMTHQLAAKLLREHRYILITTSFGKYIGRYEPPPI